jgi:MerR family transcriptional regulator/heat shock protein HspR
MAIKRTRITIAVASRRTGLSTRRIRSYIRRKLVDDVLTEAELARLRRIRRLCELGINLAGIQVILQMRRRIEELQAKVAQLEAGTRARADQDTAYDRALYPRKERVE